MKRKYIIGFGVLALIAIIVGIVAFMPTKKESDGYDIAAEGLDVEFNADIIVYGEVPKFRNSVKYRVIDKVTEKNLNGGADHGYRAIVLYDYEGTMNIDDKELLLIKTYVEENGYDMFYVGKNYLDDFERLGFTVGCAEGECSLEYLGSFNYGKEIQQDEVGNLYAEHGLWCDDDEKNSNNIDEEIQYRILILMYDYARKAAGIEF